MHKGGPRLVAVGPASAKDSCMHFNFTNLGNIQLNRTRWVTPSNWQNGSIPDLKKGEIAYPDTFTLRSNKVIDE